MNSPDLAKELADLLVRARHASEVPGAYPFFPEIIRSLEAMETNLGQTQERRSRMAGALGRLITEDLAFSDTPLGLELLRVADEFASFTDRD